MTLLSPAGRTRGRRAYAKSAAVTALVAVLLGGATGCSGPDVTRARLEASIEPTFMNLYKLQQNVLQGSFTDQSSQDMAAHCTKGGQEIPQSQGGAGVDWSCQVQWPSPTGPILAIAYEVAVQPTGCYTAQGPANLVGQQKITGADGRVHTNPLYEFDNCLDTTG
ncbi:hypothetical protein AB0N06_26555 [Streptomyces sp. NPDC051020]|uniref:hypothetical protein n=1 Tax=Streptomyces sp. NPDC051020 TaxID=3155409 RepID=UPI00343B8B5F